MTSLFSFGSRGALFGRRRAADPRIRTARTRRDYRLRGPEVMEGRALLAPVLGGQIFTTGGPVEVEIGPPGGAFVSNIFLDSPGPAQFIGTSFQTGKVVNLGSFPAGVELVFRIDVTNTGDTFYTGPASRNPDGIAHATVNFVGAGVADVGFEDLFGGGDQDFDDVTFQVRGAIAPVAIDIKPGSDPNSINPRNNGNIPVAIFGSASFDVTSVDLSKLTFGPDGGEAGVIVKKNGKFQADFADLNGDGFLDLVVHFNTKQAGFQAGDTVGIILLDGQFLGQDSVRIVPPA